MFRLFLTTLSGILVAVAASGQDGRPLSLDDAVALAMERNPAMHAAQAAGDEADARVGQAKGGYLPRLDFVEAWQGGNQPVYVFGSLLAQRRFTAADFALNSLNHPDPLSNHRAAIVVQQTLFDGFATRAAADGARLGASAAQLEREIAGARLRLEVVRAFGRALQARAARAVADAAVATAAEDVRRSETRRDEGLETEANVLAFRVHLAGAEAEKVRASAEETVARAALNSLIAAPLDDMTPLVGLTELPQRDVDPVALEAQALAHRPELQQARLSRDQAEAARLGARAGYLPHVLVNAGAEMNGETFTDRASAWSAALEVRWNLFAGGSDSARVAEASAAMRRADAERERLESMVKLEVRTTLAGYQAAVAREATGRRAVEQARESQRIIRDRYDAGLAPASDVLRAAELLAQAESARTGAVIDVHLTAAGIDRAVGRSGLEPGSKQ
jgi:outer membrane protein TolC